MKDDTKITVKWNAETSFWNAKVDYKGQTSTFPINASSYESAMNVAKCTMVQYKREVGDK